LRASGRPPDLLIDTAAHFTALAVRWRRGK
jgi:hypothetical protein